MCFGQSTADELDSTGLTAAGPRLGPVAIVKVKLINRQALSKLIRHGFDISYAQSDLAIAYAIQKELDWLDKAGYDYNIIEWQPNPPGPGARGLGVYHDYTTLTSDLEEYADDYPNICRLYTLGQSVGELELWAMLITDNPDDEEDEPEFNYVSTMHGNERLGVEMCLYFIDKLLTEYDSNDLITDLVDSTAIWIVPLMNPDGLEDGKRVNAEGYNLNRSFPVYYWRPESLPEPARPGDFMENLFHGPPMETTIPYPEEDIPEVVHVMNWAAANSFVLSGNFHTGAVVMSYPYDYDIGVEDRDNAPTPDDLLFEDISRRYSIHNTPMWDSQVPPRAVDGIVNGNFWYRAVGTMTDWDYRYVSDNDVTIELYGDYLADPPVGDPPEAEIPDLWTEHNEKSMLSYLEAVHIGVRGIVTDSVSGEPLYAEVWVEGNYHPVYTDPDVGDYHRMLLPGTYNLAFYAPGYAASFVESVTLTEEEPTTRVDVQLVPGIDPVNWWKLDKGENPQIAYDSVGTNNGVLGDNEEEETDDPTWIGIEDSIRGWCLYFNSGEGDKVSISSPIDALTGDMVTISAWIKADTTSGYDPILVQWDPISVEGYYFCLENGKPQMWIGNYHAESPTAITTDWHHVAGTYNGLNLKIYVDGELTDTNSVGDLTGFDTYAYIGWNGRTQDALYFDGKIDDVRVYNMPLHVYDIWELMFSDASVFGVKNSLSKYVACFDDLGNLFLKGSLEQGNGDPPQIQYNDGFRFKDSDGYDVAIIDGTNGNMYIKETLQLDSDGNWVAPTEGDGNFRIKDSGGDVAYISKTGYLYLKGGLYENPEQ